MKIIPTIENKKIDIILLCSEEKYTSSESLSEHLNVSTRSISNYIKDLNFMLGDDIVSINYVKTKGYKLNIKNLDLYQKLIVKNMHGNYMLNSKEERVLFLIERLCSYNDFITLGQLSQGFNISRSTLVNDIARVEEVLEEYNCSLQKVQNVGIKILGEEVDIRIMMLSLFCKTELFYLYDSKLFSSLNISKDRFKDFERECKVFFKEQNFSIVENVIEKIIKYIIIGIYRIKQGFYIGKISKKYKVFLESKEYKLSLGILHIANKVFDGLFKEIERFYITLPLLVRNAPYGYEINSNEPNEEILILVEEIVEKIYEKTGLVIDDLDFKYNLAQHLLYTMNRIIFNINIKNTFLNEIKDNYRLPYELARLAIEEIEKKYNVAVPKDELGYIAVHFGGYLESKQIIDDNLKKIAVISDLGLGTTVFIKSRIQKIVRDECEIDIFTTQMLNKETLKYYDLIFTTSDIISLEDQAFISISPLFNKDKITDIIKKQIYFKSLDFNKMNINKNLLFQFMPEENLLYSEKLKISEVLEEFLSSLYELGYIKIEQKSEILNKEITEPIIFEKGVILSHFKSSIVNDIMVCIGRLKNNIAYKGKLISIVIFLIFPDEIKVNPILAVDLYDEILNIIYDNKKLDKLRKISNYNDLINDF